MKKILATITILTLVLSMIVYQPVQSVGAGTVLSGAKDTKIKALDKAKQKDPLVEKQQKDSGNKVEEMQALTGSTIKTYYARSPHNYSDNFDHTWTIKNLGSSRFRVHFTRIETEAGYDFVRTSTAQSWSGSYTDVWSDWVYGNELSVRLTADYSNTAWGFEIDKVEYEGSLVIENQQDRTDNFVFESVHPYADSWWYSYWIGYSSETVKKVRVHFAWIDTESGYDVLTTSAGDYYSGYFTDVWSSWADGDKLYMEMSTDVSIQKNGFYIDKIEYISGSTVYGVVSAPEYTQQPYNQLCWATSSAMVDSHFLWDRINRNVEIAKDRYGEANFNQPGNMNDMEYYVRKYTGIYGAIIYSSMSFASIMTQIDRNAPSIARIGWSSGGGHAQVIRGYDTTTTTDYIIYNDPWDGTKYIDTYSHYKSNSSFTWTHSITFK